ncbi:hypothetical protein IHP27_00300 [Bacillus safensis]|uniref:hypothetical protein n=1 Tax=Bacillus safensis TaxID=561879 RepID=UPI001B3A59ED|nr:hypothetical protein [Bacillus safensis]MBQ4843404.1 hypothetical protein [Bacillus safensis]MBQ4871638.1 hypothetical protein [Bacillus safensis]MBQ4884601.1 hypothetical protein [Bacillus safensis]
MSKKKNVETNTETKNEKLLELENVIYTYPEKELLPYFLEEFKHGKNKDHYKGSIKNLHDLDIECIEFAISRFSYIDNNKDPNRRYLPIIVPLFIAYLSFQDKLIPNKLIWSLFVAVSILWLMKELNKDRKDRSIASSMLKTFEQVHTRKQKDNK